MSMTVVEKILARASERSAVRAGEVVEPKVDIALSHENAALVLKTYGHLMPDSEDRTRRAIDDAWTSDGTQTESDHR